MDTRNTHTAFAGMTRIAAGPLTEVALVVKHADPTTAQPLVFDDHCGRVVDLDLRGTDAEVIARYQPVADPVPARKRGRPKLGVVAREVTLLPRHWDWLSRQPGGASRALRRLVDDARRADAGTTDTRQAQEAAYRFMSALAGNLPGFEEASRALFSDNLPAFEARIANWPKDVKTYALRFMTRTGQPDSKFSQSRA
ncbi:hypothetical protein TG4357_00605 [Thalassovita gelatinovora]|uniref:DUF2239 domain-containing protein n=1 Tax=Thalassovita gelatinovora TaxID=53501 RepID=A0A0P1F621_THAGE|nr:DUF2239 family protein [Thalassovita gelatinovora]QIZ80869.1 DUF2239 family protein [Thalassovita gelatinovora]CUH63325.1 hypothetical protein TG4357_00605 [Thalassovita gelatinovora]SEQ65215.1 hypothetical protein SAMN04488043_107108 [Thalassovita gelatinovora]